MSDAPDAPVDTAAAAAARLEQPVSRLGGGFMGHPSLLAAGSTLGYESNDFYYAGRVGAMGEVSATVAASALVFFAPQRVETAWHRSFGIQSRSDAALLYRECASKWADAVYVDDVDWRQVADDADRVLTSISFASAPLLAGWLSLPDGTSDKARAQHRLNALREYRMAVHAAALLVAGVSMSDAVRHAAPQHVELFGWSPEFDDHPEAVARRWREAETATDRLVGSALSTLGDDLDDVVGRWQAALAAVFARS